MTRTPMYNQIWTEGQPTGLYELVGHVVNKRFVRNRTVSPLRTMKQWQAIDRAQPAPAPRRKVSLTAVVDAALTAGVPAPPSTLRAVVNEQRRRLGADLLQDPAPALRSNMGVPPVPNTLARVVQLQRERGTIAPADVRTTTQVQTNAHHKNGFCYRCAQTAMGCLCPSIAPLVVNHAPAPRQPEPMLCRHCHRSSCICQIEL